MSQSILNAVNLELQELERKREQLLKIRTILTEEGYGDTPTDAAGKWTINGMPTEWAVQQVTAAFKELGSATNGQIAEHLGVAHATINRTVGELVLRGVLRESGKDGRAQRFTLVGATKPADVKVEDVQVEPPKAKPKRKTLGRPKGAKSILGGMYSRAMEILRDEGTMFQKELRQRLVDEYGDKATTSRMREILIKAERLGEAELTGNELASKFGPPSKEWKYTGSTKTEQVVALNGEGEASQVGELSISAQRAQMEASDRVTVVEAGRGVHPGRRR